MTITKTNSNVALMLMYLYRMCQVRTPSGKLTVIVHWTFWNEHRCLRSILEKLQRKASGIILLLSLNYWMKPMITDTHKLLNHKFYASRFWLISGYLIVVDWRENHLHRYITQEGYRMEAAPRPPTALTNAVSWRSEGIRHRKNEIFLDVVGFQLYQSIETETALSCWIEFHDRWKNWIC